MTICDDEVSEWCNFAVPEVCRPDDVLPKNLGDFCVRMVLNIVSSSHLCALPMRVLGQPVVFVFLLLVVDLVLIFCRNGVCLLVDVPACLIGIWHVEFFILLTMCRASCVVISFVLVPFSSSAARRR